MKKTLLIFCALFSLNSGFAQLYVKDAYVYNKGAMVFVKDYVELNTATSNIYLRNEGQLLQGSTSTTGLNRGVGRLSVFQEGTSNNYGYNYWCSPVGAPLAAAGNNTFIPNQILNRPTSLTATDPVYFTSSLDGSNITSPTYLIISKRWIYKYVTGNSYANWNTGFIGDTGTITSGLGYTMKGVYGDDTTNVGETTVNNASGSDYQRYDFRGKPNEGTIDIPVAYDVAPPVAPIYPNTTLTGNPYPSAINLNLFLLENSGYTVNYSNGTYSAGVINPNVITGNAYFWEHQKPATSHILVQYIGGYGSYSPNNPSAFGPGTYNPATWNTYNIDGSVNTPGASTLSTYKRMFCPVGQGFMVRGSQNGNAQMKNLYRAFVKEGAASNSEFEKNANTSNDIGNENWPEILNVAGVDYTQFSTAQTPQVKIHTIFNNLYTKEVTMAFNSNTSDGYDAAMDVSCFQPNLINDAYFSIPNNADDFVITTLPFSLDKRIPFTLKAGEQTAFRINVSDVINFNDAENVYLFDGTTGVYHDIKNDFFDITLPTGIYANRFEITFKNEALSVSNPIKENVTIIQNNTNQLLTVLNPNLMEIKSVILFDITGKLIFNKTNLGSKNSYEFSTSSLSDAVYLVKIQSSDGQTVGQKIIISNKPN